MMDFSWELLNRIGEEYGDSFYILDVGAFRANYSEFLSAFRRYYPKTNIAYSYKTNYIPRLCQSVNAMGGYAEVVSSLEYDLALRVGVPPQRIVFNGPYKREVDIEKALLAGSIVNLDSFHEVAFVEAVAQKHPEHTIAVGLRCNFDIGTDEPSRFGFDVEGDQFKTAFEALCRLNNCRVDGLHCHFTTQHRSVESYAHRTRRMLELAALLWDGAVPQFINLGGGFFGKMGIHLQEQFSCPVPSYQEYADAIATQLAEAFPDSLGPELILEPGTAIAADVMQFAAKIIGVKTVRSRTVALSAGSVHNIKPTMHGKNLPMRAFSKKTNQSRRGFGIVDVVGNTCMEHDCLYRGYKKPIDVSDYVVFENVGAYTVVMRPPFIHPCPAIIACDSMLGTFDLIKRQEKSSDVFSTYVF